VNVGEIHGDADDIFQFEACGLQDLLDVIERRSGFGSNSTCDQFVGRIRTLLACDVQCVSGDDSVTEWKSSGDKFTAFFSCAKPICAVALRASAMTMADINSRQFLVRIVAFISILPLRQMDWVFRNGGEPC
jgi:hypothetical protein